jgi:hypothetical protein
LHSRSALDLVLSNSDEVEEEEEEEAKEDPAAEDDMSNPLEDSLALFPFPGEANIDFNSRSGVPHQDQERTSPLSTLPIQLSTVLTLSQTRLAI